jgi:preprotein translocase subunit SecF
MSLDFTGGTSIQVKFSKPVTVDQIRSMLEKNKLNAGIQGVGLPAENTFLLRMGLKEMKGDNTGTEVAALFKAETGDQGIVILEENMIGPLVSAQLKQKALYAVVWAAIGILIYIWIRFKFKFAVVATIATLHDVLTLLAVIVLLGNELDILVLTALLTIAGYSLTDTVVVFDRIRENMKHILKMPLDQLVNKSINEVLSRSIITSLTTLLVVVALLVFGGYVLHNFAFALCIGILIGTYSSVFLAAPLIVDWENFERKNRAVKQ